MSKYSYGKQTRSTLGSDEIRFWSKVDKKGECWIWTGSTNPDGYGRFKVNGKLEQAHRFSFNFHFDKPEDNKHVLHKCDVRCCVNPDHLFLGSHSDNMKDMYKKERHNNRLYALCHPEKKHHSKGLCRSCYMKNWHASQPGKQKEYYHRFRNKQKV